MALGSPSCAPRPPTPHLAAVRRALTSKSGSTLTLDAGVLDGVVGMRLSPIGGAAAFPLATTSASPGGSPQRRDSLHGTWCVARC